MPHLHHQSSQPNRAGNHSYETQHVNWREGSQTQGNVYTGSGSESDMIVVLSPEIHTSNIGWFVWVGFDQQVKRLTNAAGFQERVIQEVYRHAGTFREAEEIVKAMSKAVVECARAEIESQETDDEESDWAGFILGQHVHTVGVGHLLKGILVPIMG